MNSKRGFSALGLFCALASPLATAASFECTYLADAKVDDWSWPTGLNDAGTVVGIGSADDSDTRAVRWDGSGVAFLGDMYSATAINSKGWVSGTARDRHGRYAPQLWKKGKATTLPPLGDSLEAQATSLNDEGLVVGFSELVAIGQGPLSEPHYQHAVLWHGGPPIDLGTLATPDRQALSTSKALDINRDGLIVGYSNTYRFNSPWAVSWTESGGIVKLRNVPGATSSEAAAVNDRGTIVGLFLDDSTIRPVAWKGKRPKELALAAGLSASYATDVNDADQVVGKAASPVYDSVAVWWPDLDSPGQDLNSLVDAGGCTNDAGVPYTLTVAAGINRDGVIVSIGQPGNNTSVRGAFKLTPR